MEKQNPVLTGKDGVLVLLPEVSSLRLELLTVDAVHQRRRRIARPPRPSSAMLDGAGTGVPVR